MPYKIFRTCEEHCIYKLNAKGERTGDSLGCHPSPAKAGAQMRALYAAEDDEGERDAGKAAEIADIYDSLGIGRPARLAGERDA